MKSILSFFSLIVFIAMPYYSQSQEMTSKNKGILYCRSFSSMDLINNRLAYKNCHKHDPLKAYYKIYKKNKLLQKVEQYNAKDQLINIETFTYRYSRVIKRHMTSVYSSGNSRYLTHRYFRVVRYAGRIRKAGGEGENQFKEYGIKAQLNMHNGKKYRLFYVKKIEKYKNSLLSYVSYYDQNPGKKSDRLRIKIFYDQQQISGYKIKRYHKAYTEEEYYEGKRRWINLYNPLGQPEIGFYFNPESPGFFFSVYYYDKYNKNNQLLIKENYYTRNSQVYRRKSKRLIYRGNVHKLLLTQVMQRGHVSLLKTIVNKMFQARSLLKRKRTLDKRRKLWEKTFLVYGGKRKVERKSIWYFQKKETVGKLFVNQPYERFNDSIDKIEYYKSDVLRRVEYFNPEGRIESVNHYNYKGERDFDKE
ncbi:MAG: hypothetical protein IEMM0008_0485 [bacterium]|nr:MAG: hypothetical protein IEMM0008_0485 [bacterium]